MNISCSIAADNKVSIESLDTVENEAYLIRWENIKTDKNGTWSIDKIGSGATYILKSSEGVLSDEFMCCGTLAECINYVVDYYRIKLKKAQRVSKESE